MPSTSQPSLESSSAITLSALRSHFAAGGRKLPRNAMLSFSSQGFVAVFTATEIVSGVYHTGLTGRGGGDKEASMKVWHNIKGEFSGMRESKADIDVLASEAGASRKLEFNARQSASL